MDWLNWLTLKGFSVYQYPSIPGWLVYAPGCRIHFRTDDLADFGKRFARCRGYNV